jgi:hypothetical protein
VFGVLGAVLAIGFAVVKLLLVAVLPIALLGWMLSAVLAARDRRRVG